MTTEARPPSPTLVLSVDPGVSLAPNREEGKAVAHTVAGTGQLGSVSGSTKTAHAHPPKPSPLSTPRLVQGPTPPSPALTAVVTRELWENLSRVTHAKPSRALRARLPIWSRLCPRVDTVVPQILAALAQSRSDLVSCLQSAYRVDPGAATASSPLRAISAAHPSASPSSFALPVLVTTLPEDVILEMREHLLEFQYLGYPKALRMVEDRLPPLVESSDASARRQRKEMRAHLADMLFALAEHVMDSNSNDFLTTAPLSNGKTVAPPSDPAGPSYVLVQLSAREQHRLVLIERAAVRVSRHPWPALAAPTLPSAFGADAKLSTGVAIALPASCLSCGAQASHHSLESHACRVCKYALYCSSRCRRRHRPTHQQEQHQEQPCGKTTALPTTSNDHASSSASCLTRPKRACDPTTYRAMREALSCLIRTSLPPALTFAPSSPPLTHSAPSTALTPASGNLPREAGRPPAAAHT